MRKSGEIPVLELNTINKSLPYYEDYKKRKWLIDTGSEHNYIHPNILTDNITRYKEKFIISTPAGKKTGTEYITANLRNIFGINTLIKLYIFPFSERYDVLLGNCTMKTLDMTIDFRNNSLKIKNKTFSLKLSIKNEIKIQKGFNIINIPIKNKECKEGIINYCTFNNNDNIFLEDGLVKNENGIAKCSIYSHEVTTICPEPMEIDEVESAYNSNPMTNCPEDLEAIRSAIPNLLRTDHMNTEEKTKIEQLVKQYPEIIKRENDKLSSTNLLKHKILTKDENPVYTRSYRYPQIFRNDVMREDSKSNDMTKISFHERHVEPPTCDTSNPDYLRTASLTNKVGIPERAIPSPIVQVYHPLTLVAPFIASAKILLQELRQLRLRRIETPSIYNLTNCKWSEVNKTLPSIKDVHLKIGLGDFTNTFKKVGHLTDLCES